MNNTMLTDSHTFASELLYKEMVIGFTSILHIKSVRGMMITQPFLETNKYEVTQLNDLWVQPTKNVLPSLCAG